MGRYVTLLLRVSIGIGFLSAVADRFGFWGPPGGHAVAWGNWNHFTQYVSTLTFGTNDAMVEILGISSTLLEIILGILLIIGYKIKQVAFLSGILLFLFALAMSINTSIKYALDASVYVAAFGAFLLAVHPQSKWCIDNLKKGTSSY